MTVMASFHIVSRADILLHCDYIYCICSFVLGQCVHPCKHVVLTINVSHSVLLFGVIAKYASLCE